MFYVLCKHIVWLVKHTLNFINSDQKYVWIYLKPFIQRLKSCNLICNLVITKNPGEKISFKIKMNVHACVHVHGKSWMSCMVEVRGILQKKFRSQSFSAVEKSPTRQRPFTQLWRASADVMVVKFALPNPPQTPKCRNALVSELKRGSTVLKRAACRSFYCRWTTKANVSNFHSLTANTISMFFAFLGVCLCFLTRHS